MQLPSDLDNQGKYQIIVGKNSTSGLTDVGGNVVAKMTFDVDFCSASATVAVVSSSLNSTNAVAAKSAAASATLNVQGGIKPTPKTSA